jgi:E3 ubiquitin-protein ligase UBR7
LNLRTAEAQPEGEEEDDETRVLIPSDTYDGLICSACVEGTDFLESKAGSSGYMTVVKKQDGEGYEVSGRMHQAEETTPGGLKRERQEEGIEGESKRTKLDDRAEAVGDIKPEQSIDQAGSTSVQADPAQEEGKPVVGSEDKAQTTTSTSKRDIFLAHEIRERLQQELDVSLFQQISPWPIADEQAATIASLPFDLVDREIYEPPQDDDEGASLLAHSTPDTCRNEY